MKRKSVLIYLLYFTTAILSAQEYSALWKDHFSYLNIKDVVQGNNKVYAAAENVVFSYDIANQELKKLTTVQGLSGEFISTIHYSEIYQTLLIGYENGLIEVYLEQEDDILTVVDIINKQNIPPDTKRINHFNEYNNLVYVSTDYGISIYDIERLEFGDTYYIGAAGSQTDITQTTILDGYIYASSNSSTGIKRALVDSENLINFNEWEQFRTETQFSAVQAIGSELYATRAKNIYRATPGNFTQVFSYSNTILDVKSVNNKLIITTKDEVNTYDQDFNLEDTYTPTSQFQSDFTSATLTEFGVYIGTSGLGVLASINNALEYIEIHPNGPLRNNPFSVSASSSKVWVAYGDYTATYNPFPNKTYGLSYYDEEIWNTISYDSIKNAVGGEAFNLNAISFNPQNSNQVFVSSFQHGLLELNNGQPTVLYNESNSGLESLILAGNPNFKSIRVSDSEFDTNGLLWTLTTLVDKPLKSYNPSTNQWQGYSFSNLLPDPFSELGFGNIAISRDGTKWIGSRKNGVIGYNENGNRIRSIYDENTSNLPDISVTALAVDDRNQLWIGTIKGLRVLYNTSSNFFDDPVVTTQPIIILEDGIPKELLERQFISDIEVDGSNNKWIGTIGAGVFYLTSDGQETIYHFTTDNSPLPSDFVNDISIDTSTGQVYFATEKGLVSFGSGGSKPQESLSNAFVYPNPVRPEFDMFNDKIKIKDISENCNIKITDIEGNLVAEAQSRTNLRYKGYNLEIDGGTAYWNGKNLANNSVASGVYLVMLSDLDTLETRILKLMVIR